ncbi:hypothetical protein ABEB36_001516 [Hypothenemus hampei]|uniref:Sodium-coupled monocarboxylate transporter 1 n=1 Tax=Hypothenemus hampei TaxID=57062 RepID=A0ABD1FEU8_HYPHA
MSTTTTFSTITSNLIDQPTIWSKGLSWTDYILFSLMLLVSAAIGIYFGFFGKKQSTSKEYLMGGKQMAVIPIAISLVASHTSGITLMAVPADVYQYGATYWLAVISIFVTVFITIYVYLPVFYELGITSTYEYLSLRFDERCRKCASALYTLSVFVYLPMVIYVPSLAFAAVTGVGVIKISTIICAICVFYTTIGGLKAVVWTDAIQFTVTMGASLVVYFLGLNSVGGISAVWETAKNGSRLDVFDFDPSLTKRETFWAIIIGFTAHWISHTSIHQGCTQKFLAVSTYRESIRATFYYCIGMCITKSLSVVTGLIIFTKYATCDPVLTGEIQKRDQLLPYYVLDVAGHIPGLTGLFIAGLISAALSTLSANLNSLSGTIYEDFLKEWLERHHSQKTAGHILKLIVAVTGIACCAMIFIVQHLGSLLSLSISIGSVAHGPLLGLFTLGLLFPRANNKGAFYGAISAMSFMAFVIIGNKYYISQGLFHFPKKPVTTDGCSSFNITTPIFETNVPIEEFQPLFLFRLSFYWYTLIGAVITITLGLMISYITGNGQKPVDKKLVSPVVRFLLEKEQGIPLNTNDGQTYYSSTKENVELNGQNENNV